MLLSQERLEAIHARASAVVNGFATVKDQQARDCVYLLGHIAAQNHAREVLEKRLSEFRERTVKRKATSFADAFAEFDDIFGVKKK